MTVDDRPESSSSSPRSAAVFLKTHHALICCCRVVNVKLKREITRLKRKRDIGTGGSLGLRLAPTGGVGGRDSYGLRVDCWATSSVTSTRPSSWRRCQAPLVHLRKHRANVLFSLASWPPSQCGLTYSHHGNGIFLMRLNIRALAVGVRPSTHGGGRAIRWDSRLILGSRQSNIFAMRWVLCEHQRVWCWRPVRRHFDPAGNYPTFTCEKDHKRWCTD